MSCPLQQKRTIVLPLLYFIYLKTLITFPLNLPFSQLNIRDSLRFFSHGLPAKRFGKLIIIHIPFHCSFLKLNHCPLHLIVIG